MCFWVRSLVRHEYPNSRLSAPKSPGFLNFLFGSEVHNMTMYCSSDVSADLRISALANQLSQLLEINPIATFKWLCNFISGMDPFRNLACQSRNVRSVHTDQHIGFTWPMIRELLLVDAIAYPQTLLIVIFYWLRPSGTQHLDFGWGWYGRGLEPDEHLLVTLLLSLTNHESRQRLIMPFQWKCGLLLAANNMWKLAENWPLFESQIRIP